MDEYDAEAAMAQGWLLAEQIEDGVICIQIYQDGPSPFTTDIEAITFVKRQAAEGDALARAALARCTGLSFFARSADSEHEPQLDGGR